MKHISVYAERTNGRLDKRVRIFTGKKFCLTFFKEWKCLMMFRKVSALFLRANLRSGIFNNNYLLLISKYIPASNSDGQN
jgi:hypothetical protein